MREIKFRGKRVNNGEWVYGHLLYHNPTNNVNMRGKNMNLYYIIENKFDISALKPIPVIPETIGQFINMYDKNDKEIYFGDVIKSTQHTPQKYVINFIEGGYCATNFIEDIFPIDINHFYSSKGCCIEVIGNFLDNPKLLTKE